MTTLYLIASLSAAVGLVLVTFALVADAIVFSRTRTPGARLGSLPDWVRLKEHREKWTYPLVLIGCLMFVAAGVLVLIQIIIDEFI